MVTSFSSANTAQWRLNMETFKDEVAYRDTLKSMRSKLLEASGALARKGDAERAHSLFSQAKDIDDLLEGKHRKAGG